MKRVNIREAFVGEPNYGSDGLTGLRRAGAGAQDEDGGAEALLVAIRGGELTLVVPAGTEERQAVDRAECVRGVLRLEHERVFTFEIQAGATGGFFEDEPAALHRRLQAGDGSAGLSSVTSGHDYMAERPSVAHQVMTPDPVTARPDQPVREAAALLLYHHISGLPVLDGDGRLVGVVSEADLIGTRGPGETVADVMSRTVISVDAGARVEEIAATMARARIKRVPVVSGGALVGIISRADIVRWVAGAAPAAAAPPPAAYTPLA